MDETTGDSKTDAQKHLIAAIDDHLGNLEEKSVNDEEKIKREKDEEEAKNNTVAEVQDTDQKREKEEQKSGDEQKSDDTRKLLEKVIDNKIDNIKNSEKKDLIEEKSGEKVEEGEHVNKEEREKKSDSKDDEKEVKKNKNIAEFGTVPESERFTIDETEGDSNEDARHHLNKAIDNHLGDLEEKSVNDGEIIEREKVKEEAKNNTVAEVQDTDQKREKEDQKSGDEPKSEDTRKLLEKVIDDKIDNIKNPEKKDLIEEKSGEKVEEGEYVNKEEREKESDFKDEMQEKKDNKITEKNTTVSEEEDNASEKSMANFDKLLDEVIDEELDKMKNKPQEKEAEEKEIEPSNGPKETQEKDVQEEQQEELENKQLSSKEEDKEEMKREDDKQELKENDDEEWQSAKGADSADETEEIIENKDVPTKQEEKPSKSSDGTAVYCIQDDVRFLKFVANLNMIECTCKRAGNDFVLEGNDSNNHLKGCPSSLAPRDIESIKILFLTKHLPICKRFLTTDERKVLKNILITAPYYQMDFYNRHQPYEIKSESDELVKHHMVEERAFPKREDQRNVLKSKKTILDDLKDILDPGPSPVDPNLNRFPKEQYKFGEKYEEKPKKRALDISDYPYDYKPPPTSTKPSNKDIVEERLILDLLNDLEAWRCFTFICICDILEPFDNDFERKHNPAEEKLKAALLSGVPADQHKEMLAKIDKNLRYFDDLIKEQLTTKIEHEREYMQMLKEGKARKEQLFVDILAYKNKKPSTGKPQQPLPAIVNDMFKELVRNNKEIAKEMEHKMNREDYLMERNINNQLNKRMNGGDLKLAFPKNELFERHIKECMQAKIQKEYDLIRSELEFELDRCNETTLRLFQDVLNRLNKNRGAEYENIDQIFKSLHPSTDSTPNASEVSGLMEPEPDPSHRSSTQSLSKEKPNKSKPGKKTFLPQLNSDNEMDDLMETATDDIADDMGNMKRPTTQDRATGTRRQDEVEHPDRKYKATDMKPEAVRTSRDFQTQTDRESHTQKGSGSIKPSEPPKKTKSNSRIFEPRRPKAESDTSRNSSEVPPKPGSTRRESDSQRRPETLRDESDLQRRPETLRKESDSQRKQETLRSESDSQSRPEILGRDSDFQRKPENLRRESDSQRKPETLRRESDSKRKQETLRRESDLQRKPETLRRESDSQHRPETLRRESDSQHRPETLRRESDSQHRPETLRRESDSQRKPEALRREMDSMMELLWNSEDDKLALIRELATELRRYDLAQQDPREKALATKKSYREFKDEMNSKLKPARKPMRPPSAPSGSTNHRPKASNRPIQPFASTRNIQGREPEQNIISLYDSDYRYLIVEMPMADQKLDLFHDSFYGRQKALTEITINSDRKQIRTDIEMKG